MKFTQNLIFIFMLLPLACTNITQGKKSLTTTGNPGILLTSNSTTTSYTHILKNGVVNSLSANGNATPDYQLTLTTDTAQPSYQSLVGFCASGTNTCSCELRWTAVATTGGTSYERVKKISIVIADVQSGQVKCTIPHGLWDGEIATGTTLKFNIVPAGTNVSGLSVKYIGYKKGGSVGASGDFLDETLTPFRNIHRYSCFSKRQTSHQITNQYAVATPAATPSSGAQSNLFLSSKFCSGAAAAGGNCLAPRTGWSAQSYYRNFYIRSDQLGQINSTNNTYDCPKVQESINYSAGMTIPASDQGKYWPLDTTFALATTYSSEWSVGVRSATVLSKAGDPNSDPSTSQTACVNEDTSKRLLEDGTITKCLGYAKRPAFDGTCGSIKDNNGHVRPMTRLRRFRVIYPPVFKPDGSVADQKPYGDEVYVADRLVMNASGVPTGNMIYGPKPCNFAWFDHEGVVNRTGTYDFKSDVSGEIPGVAGNFAAPGYVATSAYQYSIVGKKYSVNPDGLFFPNYDQFGGINNASSYGACSATLPVVVMQMGSPNAMRLLTTNNQRTDKLTLGTRDFYLSEVHVQPIDPWTPNYLEDTSFQACVPLSDPYLEPPLHFYKKDANTMAWCSKAYPTQNPYWADLNQFRKAQGPGMANVVHYPNGGAPANTAQVKIYTSHEDGAGLLDGYNSCTGFGANSLCNMTGGDAFCPAFLAKPATTCDRTVLFDPNQLYRGFPLQASDSDIESMLANDLTYDKNYTCQYSVNTDPNKIKTKMPLTGCCGVVGGLPLLQNLITGAAGSAGHLEPYKSVSSPTIRFCGSPVE